jgi:hypothetical protein
VPLGLSRPAALSRTDANVESALRISRERHISITFTFRRSGLFRTVGMGMHTGVEKVNGPAHLRVRRSARRAVVMTPITSEPGVVELSREEGRQMLDERTRRELGMTLEEFETAYDAGTLDLDRSDVIGLVMLLPFAR